MAELVLRIGKRSAQGLRSNNEDRFAVAPEQQLFLVADGMGGQERGEIASGMAADLLPRVIGDHLAAGDAPADTLAQAIREVNDAIVTAGKAQPEGRRMGTTAVVALMCGGQAYVTHVGDSRAYLLRGDRAEQLTVDHSVAQALVSTGALSAEDARHSPYQHILHKFLGCASMTDAADVHSYEPRAGDRLLLATDGLTNYLTDSDLRQAREKFPDPQAWADHLVESALQRGTRDNVTCVVIDFDPA